MIFLARSGTLDLGKEMRLLQLKLSLREGENLEAIELINFAGEARYNTCGEINDTTQLLSSLERLSGLFP